MTVRILIVDDSKLARIVAGRTLAALQPEWERIEAGNAEAAMSAVHAGKIDVALLDFNMPGSDGLTLAAELRELYPHMPIALITANIQEEVVARARALNAAFVEKPLTEDGLRGFVSGAMLHLKGSGG